MSSTELQILFQNAFLLTLFVFLGLAVLLFLTSALFVSRPRTVVLPDEYKSLIKSEVERLITHPTPTATKSASTAAPAAEAPSVPPPADPLVPAAARPTEGLETLARAMQGESTPMGQARVSELLEGQPPSEAPMSSASEPSVISATEPTDTVGTGSAPTSPFELPTEVGESLPEETEAPAVATAVLTELPDVALTGSEPLSPAAAAGAIESPSEPAPISTEDIEESALLPSTELPATAPSDLASSTEEITRIQSPEEVEEISKLKDLFESAATPTGTSNELSEIEKTLDQLSSSGSAPAGKRPVFEESA